MKSPLRAYAAWHPTVAAPWSAHPTAALIGRVSAGPGLRLAAYAVLRADGETIEVGARAFFGERATVHIADSTLGARIGDEVTVGRFTVVHACSVGEGVVVGDGAVVLDGATVGAHALIAPGALVPPRKQLEGGLVYEGSPAVAVRRIERAELAARAAAMRNGSQEGQGESIAPPSPGVGAVWSEASREASSKSAYVAPNAVVSGDVTLGDDAGVYFSCIVAAGGSRVSIGARSNIQDNSLLVTDTHRGSLEIGEGVTVGHNVRIGSGRIDEGALIGIGSCLGDDVIVERNACVGARAVVEAGTVVRAGWIWAGRPAQAFREVKATERAEFDRGRDVYIRYGAIYLGAPA